MPRSVWKGPYIHPALLKIIERVASSGSRKQINTYSRSSTILPQMVGLTLGVYNGRKFVPVLVNEDMVGHKLGQYSPTRTFYGHGVDRKAKRG